MKTILALVLAVAALQQCVATPLPEPGTLRVPRIYNALITTDAKLQPSRASPYSVPAVPVLGPALGDFARVEESEPHHHATGKKEHHENHENHANHEKAEMAHRAEVPAGKDGKKPSSRMYPETFYPQSVGYYPHPFIPYSYPLAPQPYPFGQYSSAGVGGGPSYSPIGAPGFGVDNGAGYPYGGFPYGQGGMPADFSVDQSSSLHITSGRKHGMAHAPAEQATGSEGDEDEEEDDDDDDDDDEKR